MTGGGGLFLSFGKHPLPPPPLPSLYCLLFFALFSPLSTLFYVSVWSFSPLSPLSLWRVTPGVEGGGRRSGSLTFFPPSFDSTVDDAFFLVLERKATEVEKEEARNPFAPLPLRVHTSKEKHTLHRAHRTAPRRAATASPFLPP